VELLALDPASCPLPVQLVMERKMMVLGIKKRAEASLFAPEPSASS
jgi:hypothetical protein